MHSGYFLGCPPCHCEAKNHECVFLFYLRGHLKRNLENIFFQNKENTLVKIENYFEI